MNLIDLYLVRVNKSLVGYDLESRSSILMELKGDIIRKVRAYEDQGMSEEEAVRKAIDLFGKPKDVAQDYFSIRAAPSIPRRYLLFFGGYLAALIITGALSFWFGFVMSERVWFFLGTMMIISLFPLIRMFDGVFRRRDPDMIMGFVLVIILQAGILFLNWYLFANRSFFERLNIEHGTVSYSFYFTLMVVAALLFLFQLTKGISSLRRNEQRQIWLWYCLSSAMLMILIYHALVMTFASRDAILWDYELLHEGRTPLFLFFIIGIHAAQFLLYGFLAPYLFPKESGFRVRFEAFFLVMFLFSIGGILFCVKILSDTVPEEGSIFHVIADWVGPVLPLVFCISMLGIVLVAIQVSNPLAIWHLRRLTALMFIVLLLTLSLIPLQQQFDLETTDTTWKTGAIDFSGAISDAEGNIYVIETIEKGPTWDRNWTLYEHSILRIGKDSDLDFRTRVKDVPRDLVAKTSLHFGSNGRLVAVLATGEPGELENVVFTVSMDIHGRNLVTNGYSLETPFPGDYDLVHTRLNGSVPELFMVNDTYDEAIQGNMTHYNMTFARFMLTDPDLVVHGEIVGTFHLPIGMDTHSEAMVKGFDRERIFLAGIELIDLNATTSPYSTDRLNLRFTVKNMGNGTVFDDLIYVNVSRDEVHLGTGAALDGTSGFVLNTNFANERRIELFWLDQGVLKKRTLSEGSISAIDQKDPFIMRNFAYYYDEDSRTGLGRDDLFRLDTTNLEIDHLGHHTTEFRSDKVIRTLGYTMQDDDETVKVHQVTIWRRQTEDKSEMHQKYRLDFRSTLVKGNSSRVVHGSKLDGLSLTPLANGIIWGAVVAIALSFGVLAYYQSEENKLTSIYHKRRHLADIIKQRK